MSYIDGPHGIYFIREPVENMAIRSVELVEISPFFVVPLQCSLVFAPFQVGTRATKERIRELVVVDILGIWYSR